MEQLFISFDLDIKIDLGQMTSQTFVLKTAHAKAILWPGLACTVQVRIDAHLGHGSVDTHLEKRLKVPARMVRFEDLGKGLSV